MGATSVTGAGLGAAGSSKGPHNGRDYFVPKSTPHVVSAGNVTLSGGAATVTFPTPLTGSKTLYGVLLTPSSANAAGVTTKTDVSGNFASFVIAGTGTNSVDWAVVSLGTI